MIIFPEAIENALKNNVLDLIQIAHLKLKDGDTVALTTAKSAFSFQNTLTLPASLGALGASNLAQYGSLSAFEGLLSSDSLALSDMLSGRFDEAFVFLYWALESDPTQYVPAFSGILKGFELIGDGAQGRYIARLEGLSSRLSHPLGRIYSVTCDAGFGDARCGLAPSYVAGKSCDKTYIACRDRHANGVNFRGFPDLRGEDALSLYPNGQSAHQGASLGRRSL